MWKKTLIAKNHKRCSASHCHSYVMHHTNKKFRYSSWYDFKFFWFKHIVMWFCRIVQWTLNISVHHADVLSSIVFVFLPSSCKAKRIKKIRMYEWTFTKFIYVALSCFFHCVLLIYNHHNPLSLQYMKRMLEC